MSKFVWGKEIERFEYDFDGDKVEVVKYYPREYKNCSPTGSFLDTPAYHIEELRESSNSLQHMLIAYIAYKNLGLNNGALVSGICRALEIK